MAGSVCIYMAVCIPNGKMYFGITSRPFKVRLRQHLALSKVAPTKLARALRKHGATKFQWCEIAHVGDRQAAQEAESFLIGFYNTQEAGYNGTAGGEGVSGYRHTPDTKARMSLVHRGQVSWVKGKQLSEEQLRHRFENKNRLGKTHSEAAKAKMRLAKLGKKRPDLSEKMRGNQNAKKLAKQ